MARRTLTDRLLASLLALAAIPNWCGAAEPEKKPVAAAGEPIKALLVLGGCCHEYAKQKDIITKGISARANVVWTIAYDPDKGTRKLNFIYEKEDWAKGFDVIVHDECSADVKDKATIDRVLAPHKAGLPGVLLHCGMHSFRGEGFPKATAWFDFTGLASTGHGPQQPIAVAYVDKEHPITKGLADWTTINEELYNNSNGKLHDTATPLARGKQAVAGRDGQKVIAEAVVAWTNTYNGKAKVFATTLGHNNATVEDARYLDLVTRGLLWSVDKLNADYLKPAEKVLMDNQPEAPKAGGAPKAAAPPGTELLVPVNLAKGKPVTASSTQSPNDAKNAVDGDPETRWCANGGDVPQTLSVDLGKAEDVVGVRINWEKDGTDYDYTIEGSADGKAWSMLVDKRNNDAREQVQTHQVHAIGTRYLKLTVVGSGPAAWASLFEIEAHGKEMVKSTAQQAAAAPATDEAKLLAGVKAPPEFNVTLFAAPPDVNYPTCVAVTPTGEVFVGIDTQGSLGKGKGKGKVVRCVDTDNDGKADQFVTFAEMDHPRGVHYDLDGTLYVLHPPFLSCYKDSNGDGKADTSEVLVRGIANEKIQADRGADHTTNGFRIGIDGWIYVAMGDFGATEAVGKDGTKLQMYGGGVVRVRTDGSGLEMYSFGQRNIYDVAVDPFLNCFTRDNTNDGGGWNVRLSHVVPTGNYGYPRLFKNFPAEIVQPLADYGGGSPCGALFIDEPAVPGGLGHSLYTVEWGANAIMRHPLTADGANFKAAQESFVKLPRPTDMDVDPAGRIYLTSWANGGFSYSGPNVGYLVRLAHKDAKPTAAPQFAKLSDEALVQQIASPSAVIRQYAQREILRRGNKPVLAGSLEKFAASAAPLQQRVAAIFTLKQLAGPASNGFLAQLAQQNDVREFALRALADSKGDRSVDPAPFVAALKDPNPRVRLQAAWGLGRLGRTETAAPLLPLVADADPIVSHVAVNVLVELKAADAALAALDGSAAATPQLVDGAVRVLQRLHDVKVVDGLVARLASAQSPAAQSPVARSAILRALCRLYWIEAPWTGTWWGTKPDTSGPYYKLAEWPGTAKVRATLAAALVNEKGDVLRGLIVDLQRNKVNFPEAQQVIAKAGKDDPAVKASIVDNFAERATNPTAEDVALLRSIALADKEPAELRAKAVRALQRAERSPAAADAAVEAVSLVVADPKASGELAAAVVEFVNEPKHAANVAQFARLVADEKPGRRELGFAVLVTVADSKLAKPDQKAAAAKVIEAAWEKPAAAAPLLRAIGRTKSKGYNDWIEIMATDANADVVRAAAYAAERVGLKNVAAANPESRVPLDTLPPDKALALVKADKGDAIIGKELFTKQGCVACHTVSEKEPPKGPFLGGIGTRYNRDELFESIMKPSAKIAQGFETQFFQRTDDEVIEGFVTREAGDEVEVRNAAGIAVVLKSTEIKRRGKRDTSIMPEGLTAKMTAQELSGLIAYLESLKAK